MFQSTHSRGVRQGLKYSVVCLFFCFNPRTRVECDRPSLNPGLNLQPFQSTHSRGVRQNSDVILFYRHLVSIHALAWSATLLKLSSLYNNDCFNPRTRVECDASLSPQEKAGILFQSTHSRGVRRYVCHNSFLLTLVSIHALAWSATNSIPTTKAFFTGFNPRTRVECDTQTLFFSPVFKMFQSTHSRGVRRTGRTCQSKRHNCFNPRTRVECDPFPDKLRSRNLVSIHALAWSATNKRRLKSTMVISVSIHALAWSATKVMCNLTSLPSLFQSTHSRGVRLILPQPPVRANLFQSTHSRGVRLNTVPSCVSFIKCFNPRTRVECDSTIYNRTR